MDNNPKYHMKLHSANLLCQWFFFEIPMGKRKVVSNADTAIRSHMKVLSALIQKSVLKKSHNQENTFAEDSDQASQVDEKFLES